MTDTPLPILGFRSWAWAECSQRLVAPVRGLEWPPLEKFEAGCSYNDMIDKFALAAAMSDEDAEADPEMMALRKALASPGFSPGEKHPTPSPQSTCGCGIYMALDVHTLAMYLIEGGGVIGVVAGWGRAIQGEYMARSQYGKVAAIIKVHETFTLPDAVLAHIARVYDVPVLPDRSAIAEDYRRDSAWRPNSLADFNRAAWELMDGVPPDDDGKDGK